MPSIFDGIGMGLGFTVGLTAIAMVRELIGKGSVFGIAVMPKGYTPISIFVLQPGAFFVLAILVAVINTVRVNKGKNKVEIGCSPEKCGHCTQNCANAPKEAREGGQA